MLINSWQIKRDVLSEGVVLSTVRPVALAWFGEYETAISFDNQKSWEILKGYEVEEEAIKGHEEFKKMSIEELRKIEKIG